MNEQNGDRTAVPASDLEPTACDGMEETQKGTAPDSRARIHFHSRTNRLADSDGRSVKAAVDGLVKAGIIGGDSPEFVSSVTQSQERVEGPEETVVTIEWD